MKSNQSVSGAKIASSFLWVLIEKFGYSGIHLLSTLILARLLSPYEFGLIGSVVVITSISNMLVESGLGSALVQKKNASAKDFNTVFTFNLFTSITLYTTIFFLAPFISNYFNSPVLKDIVRILSLTLIFNALTFTQRVVLLRGLLFRKQSFISLISLLVSSCLALLAAYNGWGVWAIVIQTVVYSAIFSIIISCVIRYIPKLEFSYTSFKELLGFGGRIALSSAIQASYSDIISSVIAKIYTIQVTGLYVQSQKLLSFPVYIFKSLLDTAAFPILSKSKNKNEFKTMCSQINRSIYLMAFPLLLIIPFNADNIIFIVLGEQWLQANKIFTILSIGIVISLIDAAALSTLKSAGAVKTLLNIGTMKAILGLSFMAITITFPIEILLFGIIITNLITSSITIYYINLLTLYKTKHQLKDIVIPLVIALISNAIAFGLTKLVGLTQNIPSLIFYSVGMLTIFAIQCLAFRVKELGFIIEKIKQKNS